ncbi:phosphotransferase enzyme family protein [Robertkochia solimangrovi]|uniref:phosphotransferase enzyme family protein n=1 Tax=Robertkochia solimangrovi TaxID=2213046 RepID=UPI00117C8F92|nr:phosphotransferase [Robertkochia solimangrovi]TRZ43975.1 hypothetical protein DMZ48_08455 [Robertkochia solimangrovi]
MNVASALSSIISPDYLKELIIDRYGFDNSSTCSILKTGINHNYLFTTDIGQKFVFRVYSKDWRSLQEIEEELALLSYLKDHEVSVSYPIKDVSNQQIQRINAFEGERFGVLFSYAEGQTQRNPSTATCYHLGHLMARMHRLTVGNRIHRKTYDETSLMAWAFEKAKERFDESMKEMRYFARAVSLITDEFKEIDPKSVRTGVVHLDMWYDNMKIKEDTEITLFDFDNCGNGWLFLDIGYSLMLLFRNEPDKHEYEKKKASFFKGYESIIPIAEEEKRLIPLGGLAIWLHYTGIHVVRFNDFANHFLSDEFLKYWIHTVDQWMRYHHIEL